MCTKGLFTFFVKAAFILVKKKTRLLDKCQKNAFT